MTTMLKLILDIDRRLVELEYYVESGEIRAKLAEEIRQIRQVLAAEKEELLAEYRDLEGDVLDKVAQKAQEAAKVLDDAEVPPEDVAFLIRGYSSARSLVDDMDAFEAAV